MAPLSKARPRSKRHVDPPPEFEVDRTVSLGRHKFLSVFRGLDRVPPFSRYPASLRERRRVVSDTWVELVTESTWMYVAPHEAPPFAKVIGWKPVTTKHDCIVVGRRHLKRSPSITLYLDALHELYHVFQRRAGRDLWDISKGYAGSPTELEAYAFAIEEARRLGATEAYLRSYLKVDWIDAKEHGRLLRNLGVPGK